MPTSIAGVKRYTDTLPVLPPSAFMPDLTFVLQFEVREVDFVYRIGEPVTLTFSLQGDPAVTITIRQLLNDRGEAKFGGGAKGHAACRFAVSEVQAEFVDKLNARQYVPYNNGIPLPLIIDGDEKISVDGVIHDGFPIVRDLIPNDLVTLATRAEAILKASIERVIRLLRWQQAIDCPADPFRSFRLYWRYSGAEAYCFPKERTNVSIPMLAGIHWSKENQREFAELLSNSQFEEPLGHGLLREAIEFAANGHLRSSAITAYVALEAGTKGFIGAHSEHCAWLLQSIQSPPIPKLLRELVPQVATQVACSTKNWHNLRDLFKRLELLMVCRNNIVHTGKISDRKPLPPTFLDDVRDILYALDVLDGHDWAKRFLSHTTLNALGWSVERNEERDGIRGTIEISEGFEIRRKR